MDKFRSFALWKALSIPKPLPNEEKYFHPMPQHHILHFCIFSARPALKYKFWFHPLTITFDSVAFCSENLQTQ